MKGSIAAEIRNYEQHLAFWDHVEKTDGCWLWKGAKMGSGYGNLRLPNRKNVYAHRYAYELLRGPIPKGLVIDHLCRTRLCVNPDHMEPVTITENNMRGMSPYAKKARQTHCKRGHPLSGDNLVQSELKRGCRACKTCQQEQALNYYHTHKRTVGQKQTT